MPSCALDKSHYTLHVKQVICYFAKQLQKKILISNKVMLLNELKEPECLIVFFSDWDVFNSSNSRLTFVMSASKILTILSTSELLDSSSQQ